MNYLRLIKFLVICSLLFSCKDNPKQTIKLPDLESSKTKQFDYTNELVNETSPYLLQHAHNPVNWKPWSEKAFELAKEKNKLIVLSIGYSSCHWCHVMEEESFEDEQVAKLMNDNFVSIKVDREERPDVDIIYQTALELVQGSGGWPLNVIMLPNGKPVYLGTYHDKTSWQSILTKFSSEYTANPKQLESYAELLTKGVQEVYSNIASNQNESINKDLINSSIIKVSKKWDKEWGGNLGQQKFIMPSELNFLLDYSVITNDSEVSKHVKKTLDNIQFGGINDHIGGGFFRYSTDSQWKFPHFEKMLYDNAQILSLYAKAYSVYKDPVYKEVIQSTIEFLETEMKNEEGGYYSAIDADVNGEEGLYYNWTKDELKSVLGADFTLFAKFYTINDKTLKEGKYLPLNTMSVEEFANSNNISIATLKDKISEWKNSLLKARKTRLAPIKDDKIITSWNALLVKGYVDAYMALGDQKNLQKAKRAFDYLLKNNYRDENLVHSFKKGSKVKEVFLEDYAFMIQSALSLYKVTFDLNYLNIANELNQKVLTNYSDSSGLFTFSPTNKLITKIIRTDDGVLPSANSIMAKNLLELGHINYDTSFLKKSKEMVALVSGKFKEYPQNFGNWGVLLLNNTYPYFEVVVTGSNASSLINQLNRYNIPNMLLIGATEESKMPLLKNRYVENETYIYVCQNNTCKMPVQNPKKVLLQFSKLGYFGLN